MTLVGPCWFYISYSPWTGFNSVIPSVTKIAFSSLLFTFESCFCSNGSDFNAPWIWKWLISLLYFLFLENIIEFVTHQLFFYIHSEVGYFWINIKLVFCANSSWNNGIYKLMCLESCKSITFDEFDLLVYFQDPFNSFPSFLFLFWLGNRNIVIHCQIEVYNCRQIL